MATSAPPRAVNSPQVKCLFASAKFLWLHVLLLVVFFHIAASRSVIETLPGFSGTLPFKLEAGYVSVGERHDVQLFYYFIESEKNPVRDPLVLWLTGGPGCSAFSGLVYEIGPLLFDIPAFNGSLPSFQLNPYSWTKLANIIFLDAPVGSGFSYATTSEGYHTSDTKSAKDTYKFLRRWLVDHPKFIKNPLYIAGDSYSGKFVPMIVSEITNGNDARHLPLTSLQGYFLGNPVTDLHKDKNSRVPYAHHMALVSDEYYESAKSSCKGEYISPDPNNAQCINYLQLIKQCIEKLYHPHILEPKCHFAPPKPDELKWGAVLFEDISMEILLPSRKKELWCRSYNYVLSEVWANDPNVQEALHIRNGTITAWKRCNESLSYDEDVPSVIGYHQIFSKKGYRALIYSGDHDMLIPYMGTLAWIKYLNLTIYNNWRPWFSNGQVAGYTETYKENGFTLTFATVKGAGHTAPEYKPKECFDMMNRLIGMICPLNSQPRILLREFSSWF